MSPITFVWYREYESSDGTTQFTKTAVYIDGLEEYNHGWSIDTTGTGVKVTVIETSSFEYSRTRTFVPVSVRLDNTCATVLLPKNIVLQLDFDNHYKHACVFKQSADGYVEQVHHFDKQLNWEFTMFTHCELFE